MQVDEIPYIFINYGHKKLMFKMQVCLLSISKEGVVLCTQGQKYEKKNLFDYQQISFSEKYITRPTHKFIIENSDAQSLKWPIKCNSAFY